MQDVPVPALEQEALAQCSMRKRSVPYKNDESLPVQHINTNLLAKIILAGAAVFPNGEAFGRFSVSPSSTMAPAPWGWDHQQLLVGEVPPWGWGALRWPFPLPRGAGRAPSGSPLPAFPQWDFITVLENDVHFLNKALWLACLLACDFCSLLQAFQIKVKPMKKTQPTNKQTNPQNKNKNQTTTTTKQPKPPQNPTNNQKHNSAEIILLQLHQHSTWTCSQQSLVPPFHHN